MRARTRFLAALHREAPEQIREARADAINAGYSVEAVDAIGRTPSDVFLFSELPEADQQAILRQANAEEFDRYITTRTSSGPPCARNAPARKQQRRHPRRCPRYIAAHTNGS
jgi:hypothetical protein